MIKIPRCNKRKWKFRMDEGKIDSSPELSDDWHVNGNVFKVLSNLDFSFEWKWSANVEKVISHCGRKNSYYGNSVIHVYPSHCRYSEQIVSERWRFILLYAWKTIPMNMEIEKKSELVHGTKEAAQIFTSQSLWAA